MKLSTSIKSIFIVLLFTAVGCCQMWSVEMFDGNAQGMGSIIKIGEVGGDGYCDVIIATADHVVESSKGIRAKLETGKTYDGGEVVSRNRRSDLALVRIRMKADGLEAVELSDKAAEEGDTLNYVGRFRRKFKGDVSCLVYDHELWCDVVVIPGDSGGAVLLDGKLIGCISGGLLWADNVPQRTWPCRSNNLNPLKKMVDELSPPRTSTSTVPFKEYKEGDLKEGGVLQVVIFSADWCQPCKNAKAELKRKSSKLIEYGVDRIVVVDVDKHSRLSKANNVRLYPTMLITRDGKVLGRVDGASVNDVLTKLSRIK